MTANGPILTFAETVFRKDPPGTNHASILSHSTEYAVDQLFVGHSLVQPNAILVLS